MSQIYLLQNSVGTDENFNSNKLVTLDPVKCQARIHTRLWIHKFYGSQWEVAVNMPHVFGVYESIVFRLLGSH